MLIEGDGEESHVNNGSLRMAPGLGLLPGVVVDQHFAERGRLAGCWARSPRTRFDLALHVLNHGTSFDLNSRRPFKRSDNPGDNPG